MSADRQRLTRTRRLHAVQTQMHRLEEWKLLGFKRRAAEVRAAEAAIIAALNADHPLHGLVVAAAGRTLGSLGEQARTLDAAIVRQRNAVVDQARRMKACEKLVRQAEGACEAKRRAAEALDYLDGLQAAGPEDGPG